MKKIILATIFVMLGAVSCSACAKKTTDLVTPAIPSASVMPADSGPPTPPVVTTVTVKQSNWEFTLPSSGWVPLVTCSDPSCPTALMNKDKKNAVVFVSSPFTGTFDEYMISVVRGVRASPGSVLDSIKQVEVNGHKFVLVQVTKGSMRVWMWATLLKDQGYGFSCGGPNADESQHDLCFGIASTLKIN